MGTAGAQRPKGTRRGGFQPSEKHSPGGKVSRRMPRRMRGLLTPVSVSVIGFVGGIPPCGAAYFAPGGKAGKAPPGDAPGGTTAPHAFRLSPAVRFPPDPDTGDAGLWHGARVRRGWRTTPIPPFVLPPRVC